MMEARYHRRVPAFLPRRCRGCDRIKEGVYRIGAYGPLRAFELMDESTTDKGRVRTYRAGFDQIGLRCTFTLTPDGRIAGIGLRLE